MAARSSQAAVLCVPDIAFISLRAQASPSRTLALSRVETRPHAGLHRRGVCQPGLALIHKCAQRPGVGGFGLSRRTKWMPGVDGHAVAMADSAQWTPMSREQPSLFSLPAFAWLSWYSRHVGIDDKAATATRGWFRIDPAACRVVLQGALTAHRLLLNARALGVYGASPSPGKTAATRLHRTGHPGHRRSAPMPCGKRTDAGAVHPDHSDQDRRRPPGRLSRRGPRVRRRPGEASGDPAADGDRGLRRRPDRRRRRPEDASRPGGVPEKPRAHGRHRAVANLLLDHDQRGAGALAHRAPWCNDTPHRVMAAGSADDGKAAPAAAGTHRPRQVPVPRT